MSLTRANRLLRWFTSPFYGQEGNFWRAVTVCFLGAATLWLLNALNKTYTTRITYPLEWHYDVTRYVPVQPLPTDVAVNVTARGWKLLRKHLKLDVKPAELNLDRLPTTRFITARALRPALQACMDGLQYNYLLTDTVWIEFDRLVKRRLPLTLSPATDGSALPYTASFTPDSIVFEGPASTVEKLANPYPVHLPQAPAGSSNGDLSVPVGGPELVVTNVQDVRVRLRPRPLTTLLVDVVPDLLDFPAGHVYALSPPIVRVRLQCFPEDTARLDLRQVRVRLPYHQLTAPDSTLLPLLGPVPAGVRGARVLTRAVKVAIQK